MSKEQKSNRENKKPAKLSIKEKRAEKKDKQQSARTMSTLTDRR